MTIDNELKLVKSTTAATTAPTTKLLMKTINNQNNNNQQQQKMDSKKLFKINNDNSTNDNMNSNSNTSNVKTIQSYRRKLSYEQQQTTRKQFFLNGSNNTDEPDDFVRIEDWLDEHPDFVHSYVVRKVSRSVIDKWLIAHSATTIGTLVSSSNNANQSNQSNVSNDSGTNTPVRKISAHEFEASGGGYLRPMVSTTSDGTLTFLPLSSSSKDNLMDSKMIKESNDSNDSANNKQSMQRQSSVISIRQRDQLELLYNRNKQEYERELIFELVKDICNDLDVKSLCHKILKNISILTQADRCSLFLVRGENDGLIENRYLVSQLFDVCGQSTYEQVSKNHEEIIISWGTGIVGHVAETGEAVNIPDCYNDSRFTDTIDQKTGYKTMNMLCNPIFDIDGNVMGVAQVINKINAKCFDQNDENVFAKYLQFCGIGLRNAQIYERSQLENKRNQVLLDLARMVFEKQSNIENIIYRILIHILSLLQCERCQIMLLKYNDDDDNDDFFFTDNSTNLLSTNERQQPQQQQFLQCNSNKSFHSSSSSNDHSPTSDNGSSNENSLNCSESNCISQQPQQQQQTIMMKSTQSFYRVFDLQAKDLDDPDFEKTRKTPFEGRFPINIGITGYVVTTGETLNIADAYQDNRFDPIVDEEEEDGEEASELIDVDKQNEMNQNEKKPRVKFRHRSILCMPIRNATSKIIGVAQLVNKLNGRPFNRNDENLFEAFAIFSGMGIENTHKFEKAVKSMAKQKVTLELLSYHASASEQEASKFARMLIPSTSSLSLSSLRFDDFSLNEDQMIKACIRMFIDLDFIERFHIDYKVLCKWILSVRKNYRKVLYHNWRHAFNVAQIMFAILVNTDLCYVLGELETMALIVACLCHDLDHRGTNNSFQVKTCSPLAQLYSTSTLEHHHFDQSLMILNSQGNQIFSNLSPKEYHRVVYVLKEAILATDLAVYFSKRDKFFKLVDEMNEDSWSDEQNRSLLRSMLMTCCDISAITKPWNIQKVVAELVASEFYQQGDIEKEQLKIEPSDMMNREKRDELPKMQLSFIDSICLPIYQSFAKLKPMPMEILLNGVLDNRDAWELLSNEPYQLSIRQMDTINNYNSSLTTKTLLQTETTTIAATSSSSSIHDIASNFKNDLNDHEDKDNKRDLDVHIDRDIDSNEQQNHSDDND